MTTAEIVPAEHRARVVGDQREQMGAQMARVYDGEGASVREIAERFGRSYGAAHRMLAEAGVTFRPRGGSVKRA